MKNTMNSKQNANVLPFVASLLIGLFFTPAVGMAQRAFAIYETGDSGRSDMSDVTGQLQQHAVLVLLGAVALMVLVFICGVWKACATCDKPQANSRFFSLLIVAAGLSTFCSSCSVEQQMMMEQYPVVDATAANPGCPYSNHHEFAANQAFTNRYPSFGSPISNTPSVCRHCGQKIHNGR